MGTDVKRLHYFNGQFMREPDFTAEQEYHTSMRRRHNSLLHTWGIAKGLNLSFAAGASVVTVSEGIAVDTQGREIVLANDGDTPDLTAFKNKTVYITIAYAEQETDPTNEAGVSGNTRWTEKPLIEVDENPPVSGDVGVKLILGRAMLDNDGKVSGKDEGVDPNKRRAAGVVGGDLQVNGLTLADPGVVPGQWAKLNLGAAGRADLAASLKVSGSIETGADVTVNGILHGANIVGTTQIAANAVTAAKLQSDATVDANRAVTTNHIKDGAVTLNKLATAARPPSIDGVSNPGGNIDLLASGAVTIASDNTNKRITIGENHSTLTTNPHNTTAAQAGALALTGGTLTGNLLVNANVGINTAPADALDVNGDVRVRGADIKDAGGTARITITDNGNLELKEDGGAMALAVNVDGRVGIRTADKLSTFTVKARAAFVGTGTVAVTAGSATVTGSGTSFLSQVGIGDKIYVYGITGVPAETKIVTAIASDTDLTADSAFTGARSGVQFNIYPSEFRTDDSSGNPKFIISDAGFVGVGTVTPLDVLDVNGDVRVRGADIKDAGGVSRISFPSAGNLDLKDAGGTARITVIDNGDLDLKDAGGTSRITIVDNGNLVLKDDSGGTRFIINADGRAGIRATDRLANLTVKGSYSWKTGTVAVTNGTTNVVGAGTSFLSDVGLGDQLYISGPNVYRRVIAITDDTHLTVDEAYTSTVSGAAWYVMNGLFRADYYDGTPKFFITHDGRVGIGTIDIGNDLFDVRGRCYSSGGWQTTNADYAEYFESADGSPIPVATPVVLADGGKVRAAKKGDIPFGIATENSAIVGNSYKEWPQKYLRDKFGRVITEKVKEEIKVPKRTKIKKERQQVKRETVTEKVGRPEIVLEQGKYVRKESTDKVTRVIETPQFREVELFDAAGKDVIGKHRVPLMESYEEDVDVLDEKGEPVMEGTGKFTVVERPKINPEHDETKKYLPREERPEWICVGLLGQLPLRKGKPVAPTWLKMRDLDDDVELWLVK